MLSRRDLLALTAASAAAPASEHAASAQPPEWPARAVRLIVPVAAGGPTDLIARILGDQLSRIWHQQVVVENKGGAGTNLGNELVARSEPDGYTVLYGTSSLAVNRSLYRSLPYDALTDLAPVALVSRFPLFIFVPNSSPAKSISEFIALAKANPGKLTMGSPGTGSGPHLAGELFKRMAGIEMAHVPYRGAAPALSDLIPGRINCYIGSGALLENVRSGEIRVLGTTGAQRDEAAPELPTIAEAGVPGYEASSWHALFVPAKTPPEIIAKMSRDTVAALADEGVKDRMRQAGYSPQPSTPAELGFLLKSEIDKWSTTIRSTGIRIN